MKRILILMFCILAAVVASTAQPVFTASNLPAAGLTLQWNNADTLGVVPGPGGAQQQWDFSQLSVVSGSQSLTYAAPANSPYASSFPTATLAEQTDTAWSYFKLANGRWTRLGEQSVGIQSGEWANPLDVAKVPWSFNESINDDAQHQFTSEGVTIRRTGTITAKFDGYGTIALPQGTFKNVMRIAYHQVIKDTSDLVVGPITMGTGITTDIVSWVWFQEGNNRPLLSIDTVRVTIITGPPANMSQFMRYTHVQVTDQEGTGSGPEAPTILGPENAARIAGTSAELEWTKASSEYNTRVQIARDAAFASVVVNEVVNGDTYTASGLELGTTYHWRAASVEVGGVKNDDGAPQSESDWTSVRTFTMIPTAPTLTSPENGFTAPSNTLVFTWEPTTGKSHFQLSTDQAFATVVKEQETTEASISVVVTNAGLHYWRVRNLASNNVEGEWSTVRSVTIPVVSVDEERTAPTVLWPNPVSGDLRVQIEPMRYTSLSVFDVRGLERIHMPFATDVSDVRVDVAGLETGSYTIVLKGAWGSTTRSIQVIR
ncbi:MAG: hypothetical protein EHM43_11110 [Ignavibacteriae bacterium]|nr:MAG: hypothetical protein EHM43_11110 [Ignavibacteriota bacterium]